MLRCLGRRGYSTGIRTDLVCFAEKGGCEVGHGCIGQRGGPARDESGRNALFEDGWCLSGSGSWQVVD